MELGKQKALVVLGVSQQRLVEKIIPNGRGVSHEDVELLGLEILDSTTGENIKQKLDEISLRVGKPIQVQVWLAEVFGQSMLSKRKTLFSELINDTEIA